MRLSPLRVCRGSCMGGLPSIGPFVYSLKIHNHCEIFFLLVLTLILYHTTLNPWNDIQLGILSL